MTTKKYPWRQGTAFKDGKYYNFGNPEIVVMSTWPDPRAYYRTKTKPWMHTRQHGDNILKQFNMWLPDVDPVQHFLQTYVRHYDNDPTRTFEEWSAVDNRLFSNVSALVSGIEDIFSPDFPWPEDASAYTQHWIKGGANRQITATRYLSPIPKQVRNVLGALSNRRWQMLNFLARCPGSIELFESNPALAFALANNWCFRKPTPTQPYRAARSQLRKKPREIAGWLGFPNTKACIRILSKIQPQSLTSGGLYFLREALQEPQTAKLLSHLASINMAVLNLVGYKRMRQCLTYGLLNEVSRKIHDSDVHFVTTGTYGNPACNQILQLIGDDSIKSVRDLRRVIGDTWRLEDALRGCDFQLKPILFRSVSHLEKYHADLTTQLNDRLSTNYQVDRQNVALPMPPLPGTKNIQPISSSLELFKEGREMNHCVASYLRQIVSSQIFVYRVVAPVRATLSIAKTAGGNWRLDQLFGHSNRPVDPSIASRLVNELYSSSDAEMLEHEAIDEYDFLSD